MKCDHCEDGVADMSYVFCNEWFLCPGCLKKKVEFLLSHNSDTGAQLVIGLYSMVKSIKLLDKDIRSKYPDHVIPEWVLKDLV